MDEFYDIIMTAQSHDPQFRKLSELSAGTLQRRLITDDDGHDEESMNSVFSDEDEEEYPVFQIMLLNTGQLSIGYNNQISPEAILNLLEHVREVIEDQIED